MNFRFYYIWLALSSVSVGAHAAGNGAWNCEQGKNGEWTCLNQDANATATTPSTPPVINTPNAQTAPQQPNAQTSTPNSNSQPTIVPQTTTTPAIASPEISVPQPTQPPTATSQVIPLPMASPPPSVSNSAPENAATESTHLIEQLASEPPKPQVHVTETKHPQLQKVDPAP